MLNSLINSLLKLVPSLAFRSRSPDAVGRSLSGPVIMWWLPRSVANLDVRTFFASPWGTTISATMRGLQGLDQGSSKAKRELYVFLALSFADVDTNKVV